MEPRAAATVCKVAGERTHLAVIVDTALVPVDNTTVVKDIIEGRDYKTLSYFTARVVKVSGAKVLIRMKCKVAIPIPFTVPMPTASTDPDTGSLTITLTTGAAGSTTDYPVVVKNVDFNDDDPI